LATDFNLQLLPTKNATIDRESRGVVLQHGEMRGGRLSDGNGITIRCKRAIRRKKCGR